MRRTISRVVFGSKAGRAFLAKRRHVPPETLAALDEFGLSSICNIVAAVKTAKYLGLGSDQVVVTVATDGAEMYASERDRIAERDFAAGFDEVDAAEAFGRFMLGAESDHLLETTAVDRARIFDLGYFTWVEQQGIAIDAFTVRREQSFWRGLRTELGRWDELIGEFNARTGVAVQ